MGGQRDGGRKDVDGTRETERVKDREKRLGLSVQ